MRTGTITLVVAMAASALMSAACDRQEEKVVVVPEPPKGEFNPNLSSSVPQVAQAPATAAEQKEGAMPTQGEIDPKDPAQKRAFEQTK
jgi:hypothetical protein